MADDATLAKLNKRQLLFYILEEHGFKYKDNLSMEVFLYEPNETSMKQLKFAFSQPTVPDILEDDPLFGDNSANDGDGFLFESPEDYVENYFNIFYDDLINKKQVCKGIKKLERESIYLTTEFNCDDIKEDLEINIYQTSVLEPDPEC